MDSSDPNTARFCRTISGIADAMHPAARWQDVIHSILQALVENLGYRTALARQLDDERCTLVLIGSYGPGGATPGKGNAEVERSGFEQEVLSGRIVEIADLHSEPALRQPKEAEGSSGSLIAAPLALRDRIIGLMEVYCEAPRTAGEQEKHFLQAAARLAARSLIAAQRTEALRNITRRLSSALGVQEMLDALLRRTVEELNYRGGVIHLIDPSSRRMELAAAIGVSQSYLNLCEVALERNEVDRTVLRGEAVTIRDLAAEGGIPQLEEALKEGIRSLHAVPLIVPDRNTGKRRVMGVLRLCSAQPRRFGEDDLAFIEVIAGLGAVALESARLYDTVKNKIDDLQPEEGGWHPIEG